MPRGRANVAVPKPSEPAMEVEDEQQVEMSPDEDEEEVEYEEIEEEIEEEVEEEEDDFEEPKEATPDLEMDDENDDDGKSSDLLSLPPHGSEVYIGNIPQDISESELKCFCEKVGEVFEVRIMKDKDSTENKGFAFISYRSKELALNAVRELDDIELNGKNVKVSPSQAKHRLFIGNIPHRLSEDDFKKTVQDVGPGVTGVDLKKDTRNSKINRGFAFVEYYNNACADYSRKKMSKPEFRLGDNKPTVSWAGPKNTEPTTNPQLKALYVKNLPKNVTEEQLKDLFNQHGEITKVVLPPAKRGQENSRYGFVHFRECSMATKALESIETYELEGQVLECSLAKPPADKKKSSKSGPTSRRPPPVSTFPTRRGYNLGNPFLSLPAPYGAGGYLQRGAYGRNLPAASGLAMVPMLLPDGRMAYVLEQGGRPATAGPTHLPAPSWRDGGDRKGSASFSGRGRYSSGGSGAGRPDQRYRPY